MNDLPARIARLEREIEALKEVIRRLRQSALMDDEQRQAELQIRQGIIQTLGGFEKLYGLPRSIEPKHKE